MNEQAVETSIEACFGRLYDGRVQGRCDHKLIDIIIIAVCGMITGAESWVEVETFGREREAWLATLLELPNGIPSHDTIGRVYAALDAEAFQECFTPWVETVYRVTKGQVVAIAGKTARRSHDKTIGKDAIHKVSAWASTNGIVLGQGKVDDKSNEITAIPELLRVLEVASWIVTIDAMGCQKKIAQTIRDEKADYGLSVKDNQAKLHHAIQDWFAYGDQVNFENMESSYYETIDKGHGRIEIRRCWVVSDQLAFEHIRHHDGWAGLQSIVRVQRERRQAENIQLETAFYISSLANDAQAILEATRSHWGIENSLHWVLDVTFREDEARVRRGNSPQNMTVLRHLTLNILKKDKSKGSLRTKRYKAALNTTFLEQLLDQV